MGGATIKAYLDLCRVSNLPTVWSNVLAAMVLTGAGFSWPVFLLLALSLSLFYSGGMCLNDVCDAEFDRTARPGRPIPSGRIPLRSARFFSVALLALALFLLRLAPHPAGLYPGIALLLAIAAYDTLHRSHAASVLIMAACRLLVFITCSYAVSGMLARPALIGGAVQFAYVLVLTVVARQEHRRGTPYAFPLIMLLIAGIPLLDGIVLALFVSPVWLVAGLGGMLLTLAGQRAVRGD